MKAIVYYDFGSADVLRCEEIDKPVPKDNEVLVRVRAAALNPLDWKLMKAPPKFIRLLIGLRKRKGIGVDVAGEVEAVGRSVTQFKPGDAVFGGGRGTAAEYACARESMLALKPQNVSFEQAAAAPIAGWTALQGLRDKGQVQAGQKVLINGAAGGVGTFAVQIAKVLGAEVTGVCSTRNLELVRSIGAGRAIDYTQEDFTLGGQKYDMILECVGNRSPQDIRRALAPKGVCVVVGAAPGVGLTTVLAGILQMLIEAPFRSQKVGMMMAKRSQADLRVLAEMMSAGKLTPVIDRQYGLEQGAEAVRYLEAGHARGKVILTLDSGTSGTQGTSG
jgi:NADPH:quinone reductase-like Zn-dependent oxidoreductase